MNAHKPPLIMKRNTRMPSRFYAKPILVTAAGLVFSGAFMPSANAKIGEGGFVNIEAKSGTKSISVSNDGTKYYIINQPFNLSFRISGGSGKHRTTDSIHAQVGRWSFTVPGKKAGTYSKTVDVLQVFNPNEMAKTCEQKLALAAASQNKTKDTLRNSGWKTSFDYALQYKGELYYNNPPLVRNGLGNEYRDEDTQKILVRCLGHTRSSDPRPNKKQKQKNTQQDKPERGANALPSRALASRDTSSKRKPRDKTSAKGLGGAAAIREVGALDTQTSMKGSTDLKIKAKKIHQNDPNFSNDRISAEPAADLYPLSGGFSEENQTDWVLVTGNQGNSASVATMISFYLETTSDDVAIGKLPLPALAPGQTHELVVNSMLPVSSIRKLYAHIDRPDIISERLEDNNRLDFKTEGNGDQVPILIRKRPGRTGFGAVAVSELTASGAEHEIVYDVASGAFKFESKTNAFAPQ